MQSFFYMYILMVIPLAMAVKIPPEFAEIPEINPLNVDYVNELLSGTGFSIEFANRERNNTKELAKRDSYECNSVCGYPNFDDCANLVNFFNEYSGTNFCASGYVVDLAYETCAMFLSTPGPNDCYSGGWIYPKADFVLWTCVYASGVGGSYIVDYGEMVVDLAYNCWCNWC